jgi:hypothetical protein
MTNREEAIAEAMTDIATDNAANQNLIFEAFVDHVGSDDDAYYLIHLHSLDADHEEGMLLPRTIAYLRLIEHIPADCTECD